MSKEIKIESVPDLTKRIIDQWEKKRKEALSLQKKQKKAEKKETRCPFDKTLKCEDCRLYIAYLGGEGQEQCALILASINA